MKEKVKVYKLVDLDTGGDVILHGTLNDVRTWIKNRWKTDSEFVQDILCQTMVEEEFYEMMDNDEMLINFISDGGYGIEEICEVPLDDFNLDKPSEELVDLVLEQIKKDISIGDLTALDELVKYIPVRYLMGYLPEK